MSLCSSSLTGSRSFREVWRVCEPSGMVLDWLVLGCGVRDCSSRSGLPIRLSKCGYSCAVLVLDMVWNLAFVVVVVDVLLSTLSERSFTSLGHVSSLVLATAQQFTNASLTLSILKSRNQVFPKFSTTFDFSPPIFTTLLVSLDCTLVFCFQFCVFSTYHIFFCQVCVFYLVLRAFDIVGLYSYFRFDAEVFTKSYIIASENYLLHT